MRATHTPFLISLLTMAAALPDLAKRQDTTTGAATTPTNTVTLDPASTTGTVPPTTSITSIPIPTTTTAPPTTIDDPTIIIVDCDGECEPEPEEDCEDDMADANNAAPYGAGNGTTPQPTAVYKCPGEEICHPNGDAPPPSGPGAANVPVAPYTGGAVAVKGAVGMGMVVLGLVGAWAL